MTAQNVPDYERGFPPLAARGIHTLILGSLPSKQSLLSGEYYGNPRNAFWPLMGRLFDAGPALSYKARCERLTDAGIGVWDVLRSAHRPGSADADIDLATVKANDFERFFAAHSSVRRVFFNGKAAERLYWRLVGTLKFVPLEFAGLPSTSPAYAAMRFAQKLERWRIVARPVAT